jgi:hypothetical protein
MPFLGLENDSVASLDREIDFPLVRTFPVWNYSFSEGSAKLRVSGKWFRCGIGFARIEQIIARLPARRAFAELFSILRDGSYAPKSSPRRR